MNKTKLESKNLLESEKKIKNTVDTFKKVAKERSSKTKENIERDIVNKKKKESERKKDIIDREKRIKDDFEATQKKMKSPEYKKDQSRLNKRITKARKDLDKKQEDKERKAKMVYDTLSDNEKLILKVKEFNKVFDMFNVGNIGSGDMKLVIDTLKNIPEFTKKSYIDIAKTKMDETRISSKFPLGYMKRGKGVEEEFTKYIGELLVSLLKRYVDVGASGKITPEMRKNITEISKTVSGKKGKFSFKHMRRLQSATMGSEVLSMFTKTAQFPAKGNTLQFSIWLGKLLREEPQKFSSLQKANIRNYIDDLADPTKKKENIVGEMREFTKKEGLFGILQKGPIEGGAKFPKQMLPFLFGFETQEEMDAQKKSLGKTVGLEKEGESMKIYENMLKFSSNIFTGMESGKLNLESLSKITGTTSMKPKFAETKDTLKEIYDKLNDLEKNLDQSNKEVSGMVDEINTKFNTEVEEMNKIIKDIDGDIEI